MSAVGSDMRDRQAMLAASPSELLEGLRVEGRLTAATAPFLRARVREVVVHGPSRLMIDLQAVTALDAAGIAALLDARRVLEAQTGGTLVLRANGMVCRALKETGTITAFALWNGSGM